MNRFDVAVVSYNTDFYLYNLLVSLGDVLSSDQLGDVHVWDNASSDATVPMLATLKAEVPWLRVHASGVNLHHGPALDRLLRTCCTADWVLLLDPDTEVRRNFVASLPLPNSSPPAFIGQIHPQASHLYAYLAHLLIHRPTYLSLPPFRHDGAPGRDFFRAIETRQMPYARFRWCDYVSHAGQASLRGVHARRETVNPFYAFAASVADASPASADRLAHEAALRSRLVAFLDTRAAYTSTAGTNQHAAAIETSTATARRTRRSSTAFRLALRRALDAIADPAAARALGRARRIGLVQRRQEIRTLFLLVRRLRPRRVVEIGTSYGGSLYLWTQAAAADARIVSVDIPPWEHDDPWEARKVAEMRGFARARQRVSLIRADSHAPATFDAVRAALGGALIDFLFIDGDHAYEGVRRDFTDYGALVRPGGMIALHDIQPHSKGWGGDVPRLWRELRPSYRAVELIGDQGQDGFGTGVLWVSRGDAQRSGCRARI